MRVWLRSNFYFSSRRHQPWICSYLLRVNSIRRYTTEIIANRTDNYYYFWVGLLRNLMEIPIYVANEFLGNCQNGFKRDTSVDFGCFLLEEWVNRVMPSLFQRKWMGISEKSRVRKFPGFWRFSPFFRHDIIEFHICISCKQSFASKPPQPKCFKN